MNIFWFLLIYEKINYYKIFIFGKMNLILSFPRRLKLKYLDYHSLNTIIINSSKNHLSEYSYLTFFSNHSICPFHNFPPLEDSISLFLTFSSSFFSCCFYFDLSIIKYIFSFLDVLTGLFLIQFDTFCFPYSLYSNLMKSIIS